MRTGMLIIYLGGVITSSTSDPRAAVATHLPCDAVYVMFDTDEGVVDRIRRDLEGGHKVVLIANHERIPPALVQVADVVITQTEEHASVRLDARDLVQSPRPQAATRGPARL